MTNVLSNGLNSHVLGMRYFACICLRFLSLEQRWLGCCRFLVNVRRFRKRFFLSDGRLFNNVLLLDDGWICGRNVCFLLFTVQWQGMYRLPGTGPS